MRPLRQQTSLRRAAEDGSGGYEDGRDAVRPWSLLRLSEVDDGRIVFVAGGGCLCGLFRGSGQNLDVRLVAYSLCV